MADGGSASAFVFRQPSFFRIAAKIRLAAKAGKVILQLPFIRPSPRLFSFPLQENSIYIYLRGIQN
jgi:hypothetical protein